MCQIALSILWININIERTLYSHNIVRTNYKRIFLNNELAAIMSSSIVIWDEISSTHAYDKIYMYAEVCIILLYWASAYTKGVSLRAIIDSWRVMNLYDNTYIEIISCLRYTTKYKSLEYTAIITHLKLTPISRRGQWVIMHYLNLPCALGK